MRTTDLNGAWMLSFPQEPNNRPSQPVEVPGCIETAIPERNYAKPFHMERRFSAPKPNGKGAAMLRFHGVSYQCRVMLNGRELGGHEGMWDGFSFDVTDCLREENLLCLDIEKPNYDPESPLYLRKVLSGFIPDVACTFGGIWDDAQIDIYDAAHIEDACIQAGADGVCAADLRIISRMEGMATLRLQALYGGKPVGESETPLHLRPSDNQQRILLQLSELHRWSPAKPHLYTYVATLAWERGMHRVEGRFGIRQIAAKGSQVRLNGKPIYPRGVLHWGYYDDVWIPKPNRETIQKEIREVQAMGFNMMKHCLYIPREEYLDAMDELGMLAWVELPLWLPDASPHLYDRIRREYPPILRMLARHPSVVMISLGCELNASVKAGILEEMYDLAKRETGALVRDNSGSGECYGGLKTDFADFSDYHFYSDLHCIEPLMEAFTPAWRMGRPWIFGEYNDIDTFRDWEVLEQAYGDRIPWAQDDPVSNPITTLKPDFFAHLLPQRQRENGLSAVSDRLREASLGHGIAHRKTTLEMTRAFSEIGGYVVTSIRDVPIATSGLLDDLGNAKWPPEALLPSNGDVALCPSYDLSRIWTGGDRTRFAERYSFFSGSAYSLFLLASNYSGRRLVCPLVRWRLMDSQSQEVLLSGQVRSNRSIAPGEVDCVAHLEFQLPVTDVPRALELRADLEGKYENRWPVFLYPAVTTRHGDVALLDPFGAFEGYDGLYDFRRIGMDEPVPAGCRAVVCTFLSEPVKGYIRGGGRAFYQQTGRQGLAVDSVPFWREAAVLNGAHPLSKEWDEGYLPDLRFFSVAPDWAFHLDRIREEWPGLIPLQTLLRRYDTRTFFVHEYAMEFALGEGRLLATTLQLQGGVGKQPTGFHRNAFGQHFLQQALAER